MSEEDQGLVRAVLHQANFVQCYNAYCYGHASGVHDCLLLASSMSYGCLEDYRISARQGPGSEEMVIGTYMICYVDGVLQKAMDYQDR